MADQSKTETVIGPDARIKGEMTFESAARLLGTIEGSVTAKGEFHVADGANCLASINAAKVLIDGSVAGDVTASERVELNSKARLKGDLVAAKLIVTEGATFEGHCRIGPVGSNGSANGQASSSASSGSSASASKSGGDDSTTETKPGAAKAKATAR